MAKHAIRILNYNLTLTSDDDKSYIENVAERVERNIKTLSDAMPTRNMTEVALFVAMDYCDRYMKSVGDGTSMRGQIKDYLKDSSDARRQLEEVQKENETLKAELEQLRQKLAEGEQKDLDEEPEAPAQIETVDEPVVVAAEPVVVKRVIPEIPVPPAAPVSVPVKEKEAPFSRKKNKGKKKENKTAAPVRGVWGGDAFSESADAADDIMSFFEEKSFSDDDE